jgi:hypothetical protein
MFLHIPLNVGFVGCPSFSSRLLDIAVSTALVSCPFVALQWIFCFDRTLSDDPSGLELAVTQEFARTIKGKMVEA